MESNNPVPRRGENDREDDREKMIIVKMAMSFIVGTLLSVSGFWLLTYKLGLSVASEPSNDSRLNGFKELIDYIISQNMTLGDVDSFLACVDAQVKLVGALSDSLDWMMHFLGTLIHIELVVALMILTCTIFLAVLMFYYAYLKRRVKKIE